MRASIVELVTSKKFIAMVAAILCYAAARAGFDVSADEAQKVLLIIMAPWMTAQGLADHGKARALIEAKTAAARAPTM